MEVLAFVDRFTPLRFTAAIVPPAEWRIRTELISLLADNIRNEVIAIYRSYIVLKLPTLYKWTFLSPGEGVPIYYLKLLCTITCNLHTNIFF
jgi:hypothetical protein